MSPKSACDPRLFGFGNGRLSRRYTRRGQAHLAYRALRDAYDRLAVDADQQRRELVAPEARHAVGVARGRPQDVGNRAQGGVTGPVAVHIVDELEVVEIEQHQRDLLRAGVPLQRQADGIVEGGVIQQARQRVAADGVAQRLLRQFHVGDVAREAGDARLAARDDPDIEPALDLCPRLPHLEPLRQLAVLHRAKPRHQFRSEQACRGDLIGRAPDQRRDRYTQHAGRNVVNEGHAQGSVEAQDRIRATRVVHSGGD